ncbi:MAG: hypothetical protein H3C31_12775 [Brumimicrobium sp.]|nr:hypothetical protein [Brumimicrobium sp.]
MMNKKNKITLIFLLVFISLNFYSYSNTRSLNDSVAKNYDLFYEIIISSSPKGYYSLKLQFEGLLCYKCIKRRNKVFKKKTQFIPMDKLVKSLDTGWEIVDLFNYIDNVNIMDMSDILEPEFREVTYTDDSGNEITDTIPFGAMHKSYMNIQVHDLVKRKSLYLKYGCYDERIDKLIDMVNGIVPRKYRKKFQIDKWIREPEK